MNTRQQQNLENRVEKLKDHNLAPERKIECT